MLHWLEPHHLDIALDLQNQEVQEMVSKGRQGQLAGRGGGGGMVSKGRQGQLAGRCRRWSAREGKVSWQGGGGWSAREGKVSWGGGMVSKGRQGQLGGGGDGQQGKARSVGREGGGMVSKGRQGQLGGRGMVSKGRQGQLGGTG